MKKSYGEMFSDVQSQTLAEIRLAIAARHTAPEHLSDILDRGDDKLLALLETPEALVWATDGDPKSKIG